MKYIDAFRDPARAKRIVAALHHEVQNTDRVFRFMEFCGGHTHAIFRFGLPDLLPSCIDMVHGPGCPVCVLPMGRIDAAIDLALSNDITLCAYGDMMRVPGGKRLSLLKAKAQGAEVRMVTSPHEALMLAKENPARQIIFMAIGFETTTPPTAVVIKQAAATGLQNFSVFCNHVRTPPALAWLLESSANQTDDVPPLDGFVGPSHVSAIIGTKPYEIAAKDYHKPVVIAGFEPLDVLQSILMLVRQVKAGRAEIENEYSRAVTLEGNTKAQDLMHEVFTLRECFEWRGLGTIAKSALKINDDYAAFDAEKRFAIKDSDTKENPACQCPAILRGAKTPLDCPLFGKACTPENPIGACMVSSEGGCAAWYAYGSRGRRGAA